MNNSQHLLGLQSEFWIDTVLGLQDDAHLSTWKLSAHKISDPILENSKVSLGYQPCPMLLIVPHCWHVYWLFKRTQGSLMTSMYDTWLLSWPFSSWLKIWTHEWNLLWIGYIMSRLNVNSCFMLAENPRGKCPAPWKWVLYRAYTRDIERTRTGSFYGEGSGLE